MYFFNKKLSHTLCDPSLSLKLSHNYYFLGIITQSCKNLYKYFTKSVHQISFNCLVSVLNDKSCDGLKH